MIGSRIVWGLCLIGSLAFAALSTSWVSLALLVVVIIVPLVLIGINQISARKLSIDLELPSLGEKDTPLTCSVRVKNPSLVPHAPLVSALCCENLLTGERLVPKIMYPVGARSEERVSFELENTYCGTVSVSLEQSKVFDPFGLWAFRLPETPEKKLCILPQTFAPHIAVQQELSQNIEADEYAQDRPGADPSEIFAVREYRPGDSLGRMHWKLTWKFDEMMVRESSLPVQHSFLVLLETNLMPGTESPSPQVVDATMEIVVSMCQALIEEEIVFDLAWFDHDEQVLFTRQITNATDFSGLLTKLMSTRCKTHEQSAFALSANGISASSYEHLVYVSQFLPDEFYRYTDASRATAIICQDVPACSAADKSGTPVYFCSPQNYEQELAYLEI